jgi:hypothetical protein
MSSYRPKGGDKKGLQVIIPTAAIPTAAIPTTTIPTAASGIEANYLSYKLIFITMRHFIDGRLIDSATLLSYRVAFRVGCGRPL